MPVLRDDEGRKLKERVDDHVRRVQRIANWLQAFAVAVLIICVTALTIGIVSKTLRLQWWIIISLALILAGTLTVATLARRLAIFAHLIVRIFGK